jgi:hypothetical protein
MGSRSLGEEGKQESRGDTQRNTKRPSRRRPGKNKPGTSFMENHFFSTPTIKGMGDRPFACPPRSARPIGPRRGLYGPCSLDILMRLIYALMYENNFAFG